MLVDEVGKPVQENSPFIGGKVCPVGCSERFFGGFDSQIYVGAVTGEHRPNNSSASGVAHFERGTADCGAPVSGDEQADGFGLEELRYLRMQSLHVNTVGLSATVAFWTRAACRSSTANLRRPCDLLSRHSRVCCQVQQLSMGARHSSTNRAANMARMPDFRIRDALAKLGN